MATRRAMSENRKLASESQKKANDALPRGLESQQDAVQRDARNLERIQSAAQGAQGQMQALGYANQLASHQANPLLQLRGLMIAMYSARIARMRAVADREALRQAETNRLLQNRMRSSQPRSWGI